MRSAERRRDSPATWPYTSAVVPTAAWPSLRLRTRMPSPLANNAEAYASPRATGSGAYLFA